MLTDHANRESVKKYASVMLEEKRRLMEGKLSQMNSKPDLGGMDMNRIVLIFCLALILSITSSLACAFDLTAFSMRGIDGMSLAFS